MKVLFTKSIAGTGFRFLKGKEAELPPGRAKEYIKAGFCVEIKEAKKKASVSRSLKETR